MSIGRIDWIIGHVPPCKTLADVGCDHGIVGGRCLMYGLAKYVHFIDISQPSLDKAKGWIPKAFSPNIDFTCQDGLGDFTCDCAVIAGMGGLETISILSKAAHLPQKLVLQPMRNQPDVRRWLVNSGYGIVSDEMALFADKYYDLIVAELGKGQKQLTDLQFEFGIGNLRGDSGAFFEYLEEKRQTLEEIMKQTNDSGVKARYDLLCTAVENILEEMA